MYIVHVEMNLKPDVEASLQKTFREIFRPAISAQQGFRDVQLLRPFDGQGPYWLTIAFETRELQQKWVDTDLHQDVWGKMEGHCADCVIRYFSPI